ncbi:MAG: IPT/TIG domain-containing protein [Dehalococcoidales bacterium]
MKHHKLLVKFSIILVLSILVVPTVLTTSVIAVTVRYSPHYITIKPERGPVGTEVYVYGVSCTPSAAGSATAKVYFPDKNTLVKSVSVDSQGNFETYFVVRPVPVGEHTVWAYDESASLPSWDSGWRTAALQVEAKVELSRSSGYVGGNITTSGSGFAASSNIVINFDGSEVGTAITDQNGAFTRGVSIPESENGSHSINAMDANSDQGTAEFVTKQKVTINPAAGSAGEKINVTGNGFAANKDITITVGDKIVVLQPAWVTTSQIGSFVTKFSMPAHVAGVYIMEASDGTNKAEANLVVETDGKINRVVGYTGDNITFSGTGFISDRIVIIRYDAMKVAEALVDPAGNLSANFKIPPSSDGKHTISAIDGTNTVERTFTMFTQTYAPIGKIDRMIGNVGSDVAFTGAGFVPDRVVIIYFDSVQVAEALVDPDGNFSTNFKVPPGSGVDHIISATDGTNTIKRTFTMELIAPSAPVLSLPAHTSIVEPEVRFVWEGVTDPSGVTYTLQIASDVGFTSDNDTSLLLEKSELTATEYKVNLAGKSEKIKIGSPYYWRVRAEDNASNVGAWSAVQEFYLNVSTSSPSPPESNWFLYSLMVEGGLFIGILGYWIVRKRG